MAIYLNRAFLSKALKFGLDEIDIIDPLTPLRFSNGGRQMIVMPIRADNPPPDTGNRQTTTASGAGRSKPVGLRTHQPAPEGANTERAPCPEPPHTPLRRTPPQTEPETAMTSAVPNPPSNRPRQDRDDQGRLP